jgi:hypothetical protein
VDYPITSASAELQIAGPADTILVFPGTSKSIEFTITSGNLAGQNPVVHTADYQSFSVNGSWFVDQEKVHLGATVWGNQVTTAPVTEAFGIQIGNQSCPVPITVKVSDFYLADSFETNCPDDTIFIPRGGNFLLRFSCLDTARVVVPKARILRILNGIGYEMHWNWQNPKFIVSWAERDSISFYCMFAAFADITPSTEDYYMHITFPMSNKSLTLPIWIRY